jgi:hypothetical protein
MEMRRVGYSLRRTVGTIKVRSDSPVIAAPKSEGIGDDAIEDVDGDHA